MSLSALTDRDAVLRAIAEYDELGRDTFLQKYGFGPARSYFLVHAGKRYDSKAIAGVAVGFQFPQQGPLRGSEFTGGEATVRKKLHQLGFDVRIADLTAEIPRNPNWTREETILALDLYVRRRPTLPGETDGEIIELSDLLRHFARQRGIQGRENFRNPNGVSMKVANLNRLDGSDGRRGLPHGAGMEDLVWGEFGGDLVRLKSTADALRAEILTAHALASPPSLAEPAPAFTTKSDRVSRGPAPSFGDVIQTRMDGENCVYIMRLHGRVAEHFPDRSLEGMAVLKVGRSNDVQRRAAEMNCGFPPGLDLVWKPVLTQTFASASDAHAGEQALLTNLEKQGFAIGGEFAIAPERQVGGLLPEAVMALRAKR